MRLPKWIVIAIFLFTCLFLSWFVYDRYNDHPSLKHVAAVLSNITEQDTQMKQSLIREYLRRSSICLQDSTNKEAAHTNNEMRNLVTLMDGAEYFIKKIKSQASSRLLAEKTFSEYRAYVAQNMAILEKYSPTASKTILNEYLKLNEQLLPAENATKEENAIELSAVILERALIDQIYSGMSKLSKEVSSCDNAR